MTRDTWRGVIHEYEGTAVERSYDYGRKSDCDGYHRLFPWTVTRWEKGWLEGLTWEKESL